MRTAARLCIGVILQAFISASAAMAQYPNKNIDLIVPYAPGGGFDLYARAVARAMELQLPKNLRVIVRNNPGAGSVNGIVSMYRAAPDGYTIGMVDLPGAVAPQILGEQTNFDLDKLTWLGLVNIGVYSLVVGKGSGITNLESLRKTSERPIFLATTGSNDLAMAKIAANVMQFKAQFLTGYTGGPAAHLAIIRSEADAGLGIDVAIARHLASGDLKQVVVFAKRGARGTTPGVPTVEDIGHPELTNLGLYRVFAAPPNMPEPVRAKLNEIMQAALNDPGLAKWAEQSSFPLDIGTAEDAKRLYTDQREFLTKYKAYLKPE